MANFKFDKKIIALLVIDPYNDFISEGRPNLGSHTEGSAAETADNSCGLANDTL